MRIDVVYSPSARVIDAVRLELPEGTTAGAAFDTSALASRHAGLAADAVCLGVWGRRVEPSQVLREGDRLEVYRGLQVDPKEARRLRYRAQGTKGRRAR